MKNVLLLTLLLLCSCKKYELDTQREQESVKDRLCNKTWYYHGILSNPMVKSSPNDVSVFYRGGDYYKKNTTNNTYQGFDPVIQWKLSLNRNYINFKTKSKEWKARILKLSQDTLIMQYELSTEANLYTTSQ